MTNRSDRLPRRLGVYELTERIGEGGMGVVYKAIDRRLGTAAAVKVIHEHLQNEPGYLERFRREAHVASMLTSPYIVQVIEFGFDKNVYYLATEYVSGTRLADLLQNGRLETEQALSIAVQVTMALAEADVRGVIHRDIKPENIILTPDGSIKLMDFGIARLSYARGVTQPGLYVGTVAYSAPEQFRGQFDIRSDLYSLGVVTFQMLTGVIPFQATTIGEMIQKHADEPPPLDRLAGLPQSVIDLVARCLEKNPGARFQRPVDLLTAIESAREAIHPAASGDGPPGPRGDTVIASTRLLSSDPPAPQSRPPPAIDATRHLDTRIAPGVPATAPTAVPPMRSPTPEVATKKKQPVALYAAGAIAILAVLIGGFIAIGGGGGDDSGDGGPAPVLTGAELMEQRRYSLVDIITTGSAGSGGGTGVVWEANTYILTNAHVVSGAGSIKVIDPDDSARSYPARVVAISSCDDIALLEVDRIASLKPAPFGDSKKVKAGDSVTALGFPDTVSSGPHLPIVTTGNVSRIPATFESTGQRDLIQITAPINPGNSGGPLYNQHGEVIGLNSYTVRDRQGENYAIASNEVISVAKQLKAGKNLDYTGLTLEVNSEDRAVEEELAYIDGLVITGVEPGSPADNAEPYPLEVNFLIFDVNGTSVETVGEFCDIIRSRKSGETVRLRFGAYDENDEPYNNFEYDLVMP